MKRIKASSLSIAIFALTLLITACGKSVSKGSTSNIKQYDTTISETGEKPNKKSSIPFDLNEQIKNDFMETTFTKTSASYDLEPEEPDTDYYLYKEGDDGKQYFCLTGTYKNLAGFACQIDNSIVKFSFDNKYEYVGFVGVDTGDSIDDYPSIDPMDTVKIILYVSVPDEVLDNYSKVTIDWMMDDSFDCDNTSQYTPVDEDTVKYDYRLTLKK